MERSLLHAPTESFMNTLVRNLVGAFCVALVAIALVGQADATIRRTPGSWVFGPKTVFSDGTTSPHFIPLGDGMSSAGMINVRVSTEFAEQTGNCKARPALRWSDDGITWGAATNMVAAYLSTPGITYGSSYIDITVLGTPKPWVQFGVEVANVSGSRIELCNVSIMIDPKER